MKEEYKSDFDGRLKYYNIYEDTQKKFADAVINEDYRALYRCILLEANQVCMFWQGGLVAMWQELDALKTKLDAIEQLGDVDDERVAYLRKNNINDFIKDCMRLENKIQLLRVKHHLLLPMSIDRTAENEEELANIYEEEVMGSLSEGKKEIPSYTAFAEDYARIDEVTKHVIKRQRWLNEHKDADGFFLIVGYNNTGKSTLGHHLHTLWTEGQPNPYNIAFDTSQFSQKLGIIMRKDKIKEKIVQWDEANLSGRAAMSKYNKDLIDLYWSNRSDHGFHIWCNPSLQYLDKILVKERVTAVILIHRGEYKGKRRFSLLTREAVNRILENYPKIDLETLETQAFKQRLYEGWFKKYPDGEFIKEYRRLKNERNKLKNQQIMEKYSNDYLTSNKASSTLGISIQTIKKYLRILGKKGVINLDDCKTPTGRLRIPKDALPEIENLMRETRKKQGEVLKAGRENQ